MINVIKVGNRLKKVESPDLLYIENNKLYPSENFLSLRPSYAFDQVMAFAFVFNYKNHPTKYILIEPAEVREDGDGFVVTKKGIIQYS